MLLFEIFSKYLQSLKGQSIETLPEVIVLLALNSIHLCRRRGLKLFLK
jgi:hypothetical protein